ncbi:MAG: alanine--tRNA ligase, partial [Muribaculaceae bacterium]|nr:alanine--tRNA ligase [Muribaculaceae bacterium]
VEQKGSFVSPDLLRFDFSHFQKLTPEEISRVERLANKRVRAAIPLDEHRNVPIAEAMDMGAMALFGEKYGEDVRVIKYGDSVELCGGTHVVNTGNIGMIKIVSETSIAAGIRRIEAITGARVEDAIDDLKETLGQISAMFNNAPNLLQTLRRSIDENAELRRQAEDYFNERVANTAKELLAKATDVNGIKVVSMSGVRMPDMVKGVAFNIRAISPEHTAFIAATVDAAKKPLLTVMLTDDLVKTGLNASTIVREAAKAIKGGGGGQPSFAQAGGKNADGISAAADILASSIH